MMKRNKIPLLNPRQIDAIYESYYQDKPAFLLESIVNDWAKMSYKDKAQVIKINRDHVHEKLTAQGKNPEEDLTYQKLKALDVINSSKQLSSIPQKVQELIRFYQKHYNVGKSDHLISTIISADNQNKVDGWVKDTLEYIQLQDPLYFIKNLDKEIKLNKNVSGEGRERYLKLLAVKYYMDMGYSFNDAIWMTTKYLRRDRKKIMVINNLEVDPKEKHKYYSRWIRDTSGQAHHLESLACPKCQRKLGLKENLQESIATICPVCQEKILIQRGV